MFEIFQYSFITNAVIGGLIIACVAPLIGSFLVVRRYSLMADTLSHVSLVGVAVGILLHASPVLVSVVVTSLAAVLIEHLRSRNLFGGEQLLAVFLSGSLAMAILLISLSDAGNVNLMSYLFGSITTITRADLVTIGALAASVLAVIGLCYKELFITSFDPEYAQVSGIRTGAINMLFIILVAVTVTLAIRIVGVLLIGSLMIIPVLTAITFARSFRTTILHSVAISVLSVITGLLASFYLDVPSGATVVLTVILIFCLSQLSRHS